MPCAAIIIYTNDRTKLYHWYNYKLKARLEFFVELHCIAQSCLVELVSFIIDIIFPTEYIIYGFMLTFQVEWLSSSAYLAKKKKKKKRLLAIAQK